MCDTPQCHYRHPPVSDVGDLSDVDGFGDTSDGDVVLSI